MSKLILLCAALAVFSAQSATQQSAPASPASPPAAPQQDLQTGVVIAKVSTAAQPGQSYALYIPSHYTHEKRWPIVYVFDPFARGSVPVELMKDAAELYGYIVAGLEQFAKMARGSSQPKPRRPCFTTLTRAWPLTTNASILPAFPAERVSPLPSRKPANAPQACC